MHSSDPILVQRCIAGDARAWDELVDRYGRLVCSIPRRYGLSEADAEDVMQATFLLLHQHLPRLRDRTRLSSWLITTAHRESWRVGKSRGTYVDLDDAMVSVADPREEDALAWERQQIVREALGELGGRCEQLLRALFMEDGEPSYEAIAARLNMPLGSIGPTRARCFEKLEKLLIAKGIEPVRAEATE
jgi:RNA polymerase sigma factor (sigma-70 family)